MSPASASAWGGEEEDMATDLGSQRENKTTLRRAASLFLGTNRLAGGVEPSEMMWSNHSLLNSRELRALQRYASAIAAEETCGMYFTNTVT
jgi:hypothetical protein